MGSAWDRVGWGPLAGCDTLAHARAHTRTLTRTHARAHTRSCSPSHYTAHFHPRISFRTLISRSTPMTRTAHTLVHTLAYTRVCIPPHTRSHSHTPSHTHESPFIQSHQLFGCTFQHSHTRVLTPTDTLHAHIGLACTYVLLHTCSPVRSPARRTQTPHIPGSRVLTYASV